MHYLAQMFCYYFVQFYIFQLLYNLTDFSNNSHWCPGISLTLDPFLYILKAGIELTPSDFAIYGWSSTSTYNHQPTFMR